MSGDIEDCKRHKVVLDDGSNFYFMMGEDFIQCCMPFENHPDNKETRKLLNNFCDAITKAMGGSNE